MRDAGRLGDAIECGVVEAVGGELVESGAQSRLLLARGERGERGRTTVGQATGIAGSSTASRRLRPMTRFGTYGSPISLIAVFRTTNAVLVGGANATPRPLAASCLDRSSGPRRTS